MADVARLAGVSHQTVSRVINGQNNLRPATREKVEQAIRQLGYRPNSAARALVTRRSGTIGVIGSKSGYWGPSTVHRTIQAAGRDAGYFVSSVNLQSLTREELLDAIDHLRDQSVEGIVLISATDDALEVARAQEHLGVPVVVVEGDPDKTRWTVGVDQVAGAELGTRHLIELGHTDIVHLAGPPSWTEARARHRGWQNAMYDAGLRPSQQVTGDWSAASGFEAGREIAARDDVTAVFCANDQMALGLLRALTEAGRSVPGEVSVVGFDDIPEAAYLIPPLTTVSQDFQAVGRRAIEILQAALADQTPPDRLIGPELVVRASSAAPVERN
ncbi:LacI family transcriptional regulator [Nocardioides gansuensis]|uniref:LacI family transcriptional regulator n=2 Tax=Nocardioides gansuensis TaxID=2138300 RepID=A0A2T8F951_9ACTN|nr:LacI family transcriptional regulator [Nocardioides gansuensis]